jgi:FKBP-type peptidyl-prolyl cis-trans isomerase FkpA
MSISFVAVSTNFKNKITIMNKLFPLLLLCGIALFACSDDDVSEPSIPILTTAGKAQLVQDSLAIEQYLTDNNLTATFIDESGVFIRVIEDTGDTDRPNLSSNVTVTYRGYNLSDDTFDQNATGVTFPLDNLIVGWQIGIPYLSKGGSGQLFIPSYLAYGNNPPSNNQPIIFDIGLLYF